MCHSCKRWYDGMIHHSARASMGVFTERHGVGHGGELIALSTARYWA